MENTEIITKSDAVNLFGGNQAALARALGIQRAAVSKWADGPIPERWALKIRYQIKPEAFTNQAAE